MTAPLGGRPDGPLHAYISRAAGGMLDFVAAAEPVITVHPPIGTGGPANRSVPGARPALAQAGRSIVQYTVCTSACFFKNCALHSWCLRMR